MLRTKEQRAEISRANGRKSRGPKTELGKRTSSMNGRKHGIFDQQPSPNLDQMLKTRVEEAAAFWKPRGDSELDCVRRMADARFRIDLCLASEPGLLACKLSSRYATAFTNQFFRALDDLNRLRRPVRKRSPNKSKVRIETGLEIGLPLAA